MSIRVLPAVVATACAVLLASLLFAPYVAREYRKRGEFGPRGLVWRFAGLLYFLGLAAYVLVPLPPRSFCADSPGLTPQLRPFASFDGVLGALPSGGGLWQDGALWQIGLNVVLFLPLGVFARSSGRCGAAGAALVGFGASLLIELTQLTGVWFLHPCPYRLFDVDDLIANTAGVVVGAALPVPRRGPGVRGPPPATPRPVTAGRRLLGMTCDVLLLWWIGGTAGRVVRLAVGDERMSSAWIGPVVSWLLPALLLLLVSVVGDGSSLGQRAVLLRTVSPSGRPGLGPAFRRWLAGIGGLGLVEGAAGALGLSRFWVPLVLLWCAVHAYGVVRGDDPRGFGGRIAGTAVADVRHTGKSGDFVL